MITSAQARILSNAASESVVKEQLQNIEGLIKAATFAGNYTVYISDGLHYQTLDKLRNLGYTVSDGYGMSYIISWR